MKRPEDEALLRDMLAYCRKAIEAVAQRDRARSRLRPNPRGCARAIHRRSSARLPPLSRSISQLVAEADSGRLKHPPPPPRTDRVSLEEPLRSLASHGGLHSLPKAHRRQALTLGSLAALIGLRLPLPPDRLHGVATSLRSVCRSETSNSGPSSALPLATKQR